MDLSNVKTFPSPKPQRTPEEEAAWLDRLEQTKREALIRWPAELTRVKLNVVDEERGDLVSIEFEAYRLESAADQNGNIVTKFSNGCVLTQRKQGV